MLTKTLWQALLATPCIFGVTLIANISVSLAEMEKTAEPGLTSATEVTPLLKSQIVNSSSVNPVVSAPPVSTVVSSIFSESSAATTLSQSPTSELHMEQIEQPQITQSIEFISSSSNFSIPSRPSKQQPILALPTWATDGEITPLPAIGLEVAQTTVSPDDPPEMNTQFPSPETEESPNLEDPQTTVSQPNRWHFLFKPYIYVPFTIYGDTTFRGLGSSGDGSGIEGGRDFFLDRDEIKTAIDNKLNFVFFSELEAWSPNYRLGSLININYLSLSNEATLTRPVRFPELADFIPTELQANVDVNVWSVDLAATYRFYNQSKVNPEGVSTEFDLGPFLFDVIGGLNISSVNADLDLSTNLGGQVKVDPGVTVVSPLLGGRVRMNVTPKLAVVAAGSVSGFGISGLSRWDIQTGIDWMFAGDTSLGVGYRFAYLNYNKDLEKGEDFELNMNNNGPYLSFSFRF